MKNLRKYIKNFGFVNRVVWLTVKYTIFLKILSDKQLIHYIKRRNETDISTFRSESEKRKILRISRKIDRLVGLLPVRSTCLLLGFIKLAYFSGTDVEVKLAFFVTKSDSEIKAHSDLALSKNKYSETSWKQIKMKAL